VSYADTAILASVCANSLSVFEVARTMIDDYAELSVTNLTVLDMSECFIITDDGVLALCPTNGKYSQTFGALKR
jgi:hypothetical protein